MGWKILGLMVYVVQGPRVYGFCKEERGRVRQELLFFVTMFVGACASLKRKKLDLTKQECSLGHELGPFTSSLLRLKFRLLGFFTLILG